MTWISYVALIARSEDKGPVLLGVNANTDLAEWQRIPKRVMNQTFLVELHLVFLPYEWGHLVWGAFCALRVGRGSPRQQGLMVQREAEYVRARQVITHIAPSTHVTSPPASSPSAANSNTSAAPCSSHHRTYCTDTRTHTHPRSVRGLQEPQEDDIPHLTYLWCAMMPEWVPFHTHEVTGLLGERHMAPAGHCTFVKAHITSHQFTEGKLCNGSHPSAWESEAGVAHAAVKDPLCQCAGASEQPHPSSLPLPPTLSRWSGLCALADITADTRRGEVPGWY